VAHVVRIETTEERERMFAFRYQIYVEELGLTKDADHRRRWLHDELDEVSDSFAVVDDERNILGSLRVVRVGRMPDPGPLVDKLSMTPALARFGPDAIVTTSRFVLHPRLRQGCALLDLLGTAIRQAAAEGIRLNYGDCSPHLLPFYERLGYRRYTYGFNDPSFGFKFPILMLVGDRRWFERVRSPLRRLGVDGPPDEEAVAWFESQYAEARRSVVTGPTQREVNAAADTDVDTCLAAAFPGLTAAEASELRRAAVRIALRPGDRLVRRGDPDRSLYLLLEGQAERVACAPQTHAARLGPGAVLSGAGFLTGAPCPDDIVIRQDAEALLLTADRLDAAFGGRPAEKARILAAVAAGPNAPSVGASPAPAPPTIGDHS
jgi:hypothetical protein